MNRLLVVLIAGVAMSGCSSPEAVRQRGGGLGGDTNNRPALVKTHEGSRQYWKTPVMIPVEGPPLAPSEQARYLSLPSTDPAKTASGGGQGY
jgi:hypothetical protein